MKNLKLTLVALFIVAGLNSGKAQGITAAWYKLLGAAKSTTWTAGLGWNIVDDNGVPFKRIFEAKESWNTPPYPDRIHIDGYYKKGWNFGFNFSYNRYKIGKYINDGNNLSLKASNLFAFDANAKYSFWELYDINPLLGLPEKSMFDIYGTPGIGFSIRNKSAANIGPAATLNLGFGLNSFIYEGWGIQLEAMSKFGLATKFPMSPANYLQYTFGVIYKFKPKPVSLGKRYKYKRVKPKI